MPELQKPAGHSKLVQLGPVVDSLPVVSAVSGTQHTTFRHEWQSPVLARMCCALREVPHGRFPSRMIEHIVLWRMRPDVTPVQIAELRDAVHALNGVIEGVRDVVFRETFTKERSHGYTHILRCYMESRELLDVYGPHPLHERVKAIVAKIKEDVLAVDIEL